MREIISGFGERDAGIEFGQQQLHPLEFPWAHLIWRNYSDGDRPDTLEMMVGEFAFVDRAGLETFTIDKDGDINVVRALGVGDELLVTGDITFTGLLNTRNFGDDMAKLDDIETEATRDQTDTEIEAAYNNRVDVVLQVEAEEGTVTAVRRWTPERVFQAVYGALDTDIAIGGDLDVAGATALDGAVNIGQFSLAVGEDAMLAVKGSGIATDDPLLLLESQDTTYEAGIAFRVVGKDAITMIQDTTFGRLTIAAMGAGQYIRLEGEDGIFLRGNDAADSLIAYASFTNGQSTFFQPLQLKEQSSIAAGAQTGYCKLHYYNNSLWFQDETGAVLTDILAQGGGHDFSNGYPANNLDYIGDVDTYIAGASVTAGYAVRKYDSTSGPRVAHTDADSLGFPVGIALNSAAIGETVEVLRYGYIKLTGLHFGVAAGEYAYVDNTSGYMDDTPPAGTGDYAQILGYCPATDILFVNPQPNFVVVS